MTSKAFARATRQAKPVCPRAPKQITPRTMTLQLQSTPVVPLSRRSPSEDACYVTLARGSTFRAKKFHVSDCRGFFIRAPEPLPILNPSNFVPKNGFPVVKGLNQKVRQGVKLNRPLIFFFAGFVLCTHAPWAFSSPGGGVEVFGCVSESVFWERGLKLPILKEEPHREKSGAHLYRKHASPRSKT